MRRPPTRADEIVLADGAVAICPQIGQQIEDLRLDGAGPAAAAPPASIGITPIIGKEKMQGASPDCAPASRNNQGRLTQKSGARQSLSARLRAFSAPRRTFFSPPSTLNLKEPNMNMTSAAGHPAQAPAPADLTAVKTRQQGAWSAGDYALVGTTLQIVGEQLCEALDLRAGQRVLDVAAGNGNATLAAARRWCDVVSTDYVPALLERGRERAAAERLAIEFRQADAEALPFAEESFDVVVSSFGVMFTPDQDRAAAELVRVCKPGGKIGLANWTPDGFIGQLFKAIGRYLPPPAGVKSPALWGTEARLGEMFDQRASSINATQRAFVFRYRSPQHWLDVFKTYYGPLLKTFAALDPAAQQALAQDLIALIAQFNRSGDAGMVVPSAYLEIVITRR
jgi:SAM-dependent methyltransferase